MPETLANKIAAGEVVQRPASAAKELIENALDAGADTITVLLKGAGSELIQIIDNGCGMSADDAVTCFRRHATSKVQSAEDLERILTLGFRGEALASIAAVAQIELKTKRIADEVGTRVQVHGGAQVSLEPCAVPNGTSLAIRNLFFNVPARRNFLKTPATEFKHLVETFQFLALSHPNVSFTLIHDDNEVYKLHAAQTEDRFDALRHRIGELLGPDHEKAVVPVEETTSYLTAWGFVGKPSFHRRSRNDQFLFVNNRFVKSRYLASAVAMAYDNLLPQGSYPFFALFLELDPRHVDVNVHPTKAEVKFDDDRGVHAFIRSVVKKGVGAVTVTPELGHGAFTTSLSGAPKPVSLPRSFANPAAPASPPKVQHLEAGSFQRTEARQGRVSFSGRPPSSSPSGRLGELSDTLYRQPEPPSPTTTSDPAPEKEVLPSGATQDETPAEKPRSDEQLLWQLHDKYILTQIHSGFMIVDQNLAHERILYEKALHSMQSGFGLSQQLLFPQTFDFSPSDFALLTDLLDDLRSLGFEIDLFGGRSVVVRGVPMDIRAGDERRVIEELLQQYQTYADTLHIKGRENLARSMARRSAIPHGKKLSIKEMRALIDQLFVCETPFVSPSGQPTTIQLASDELERRFARKKQ